MLPGAGAALNNKHITAAARKILSPTAGEAAGRDPDADSAGQYLSRLVSTRHGRGSPGPAETNCPYARNFFIGELRDAAMCGAAMQSGDARLA
jgi:hypothetical protein